MDDAIDDKKMEEIRQWSTFVLDDAFESNEKITEKLKQLTEEIDEEPDVDTERVRDYNFIAYLHWRLRDKEKAFSTIEHAEKLEKKPNLIMQNNKVMFYMESGEHFQAMKLLKNLENDTFKQKIVRSRALAEIAYYYSRIGPKHHDKAVDLFRRAIKDIQPERNVCWEFGLALTLRRQSHVFQMRNPKTFKPTENQKEAACLLYQILKFPSDCYCKFKALAWCELSRILHNNKTLYEIINIDKTESEKINQNRCFDEALRLRPNDTSILQRYGSHLRYKNQLEKSKAIFEQAISIRDTPFSRHHLALTLKKMVEKQNPRPKCRRNLENSYSVDKKQLKHDKYVSGIFSMTDQFTSLYVANAEPNRFRSSANPYRNFRHNQNSQHHSVIYQRFKSDNPNFQKEQKHNHPDSNKAFISMRKSPRSVCVSPNNPLLLEAVEHLRKAFEMSTEFDVARYDLGLIYRMLNKPKDALECFSYITSNSCRKPSGYHLTLANAYEQQAICKQNLLEKESDPNEKDKLEYDVRTNMWKALSVISRVIAAIPMLKTTSHCFPTLKILLEKEDRSPEKLQELAKLHELFEYTEESIKYYQELIDNYKDSGRTNVKKLINSYIRIGNFEKAICTLSLLQCTEELDMYDESFYVDTYIKGAKDSIEKGDFEMAKIRLLRAYETISSHSNIPAQSVCMRDDESCPDVLILDSCDKGDGCCWINPINNTLESFVHLKVVVNHTDCPPNRRKMDYLKRTMLDTKFIFLILHKCENAKRDEYIDFAIELLSVHHRSKTLLIRIEGCNHEFPGCKELVLALDHADVANENVRQGTLLSNMLIKMAEMLSGATRKGMKRENQPEYPACPDPSSCMLSKSWSSF